MKATNLIRALIVIIIIGGVIIIIWVPKPDPPPCLVCGTNWLWLVGIAESILGLITLVLFNREVNSNRIK